MKTTAKLVTFVLLALSQSLRAQEQVMQVLDEIINTKGVEHSVNKYKQREDSTEIHNFRIGRQNFKLFDKLQKAFTSLERNPQLHSIYVNFNPIELSRSQPWSIRTSQGPIVIGERPQSSYAVAVFDIPYKGNSRSIYAAEWWDTDDKDIRQGILVRTYGEKAQWREGNVDMGVAINTGEAQADATNIPTEGTDLMEWLSKAINDSGNLESTDWLSIFGLLTQKIEDAAESDLKTVTKEQLVVASSILLKLCTDAPLGDDEIEMCCKRLNFVAAKVSAHSMYVGDTLRLAMKRLRKE